MRVAIIGVFNSGSSILSQILENLGFEIGRPLWGPHFESRSLRSELVKWWSEPRLIESVEKNRRVAFLKRWVELQESKNPLVCAKHPLLCLSAFDLLEAWGPECKIIRASRPIEDSIRRLEARGWFKDPGRMQHVLYSAAEDFFGKMPHHSVDHDSLLANPKDEIIKILEYLNLARSDDQIENAAALVKNKEATRRQTGRKLIRLFSKGPRRTG